MESHKRNFDKDRDQGKKKVCFVSGQEVLDYIDGDYDEPNGDENDLDLDTLAPSSRKGRVKEDVYSDEEDTRNGWDLDEDDDKRNIDDGYDVIAPPKIESSGEEGDEPDSNESGEEQGKEKFTPFNMRQEREEGDFVDGDDEYKWKVDSEAYQDIWLDGISKAEMKRAKEAEEQRARQAESEGILNPFDLVNRLRSYLKEGETPMQAIQRRNAGLPIKKIGQRQKSNVSYTPAQLEGHAQARREIEEITSLATNLIDLGRLNIYDMPRESI